MKNRILSITLALALAIVLMVSALPVTQAQDEVRITFYRFFGACSDEYADVTDLAEATGECGIIQVMANKFNAENEMGIVVETQSVDWFTYYDQLTATYAGGSPPDIAVDRKSVV
jgi:multiple sugar transport system substrate-binding protein